MPCASPVLIMLLATLIPAQPETNQSNAGTELRAIAAALDGESRLPKQQGSRFIGIVLNRVQNLDS